MITQLLIALWAAACLGLLACQFFPLPELAVVALFALATAAVAALYYLAMRGRE